MQILPTSGLILAAAALPASAQLNDTWLEYAPDPSLLSSPVISDATLETDLAWGDLDQNGLTDLVVARVQPIMASGKRTNLLLMNEGGVLTDRTTLYASASDVPGDAGFDTPTADRDVVVVDVNGDGWLDVVTSVGFGLVAEAKALSHPRVYINLGDDGSGNWLGLRYEEARIPVLINFVSGNPVAARFNAVAAGDVNGDGFADLSFGDHDASSSSPFGGEPANFDTDDRLFINDGNGFFTDATMTSLTPGMIASNFCNSTVIADFDGDGDGDIAKQTNGAPGGAAVTIRYNDDSAVGTFTSLQTAYVASAYNISAGDLNGDGRLDIVVSENGNDGVLYNSGNDGAGEVIWSPLQAFDFLVGGDDSFASNSLVADLDGDSRNDVLIADVDPQISGFNRRLHIYHNRGNTPSTAALLREERELSGAGGWIGAVGLTENDLKGTHDVAVFDIDGDGLDDLLVSRNAGTQAYRRIEHCQTNLGFGAPGVLLEVCGSKLGAGEPATVRLSGAPASSPAVMLVSLSAFPIFIDVIQDTVVAFPPVLQDVYVTDFTGALNLPLVGPNAAGTVVVQFLIANGMPTLFTTSNAVQVDFLGTN
ncbi:FG-GAP repeat domain-containing protein [Engelhardtia mirabilis]|uniref:FG-GAP repeat protein n=1 Tax=Engelhardtia mirabilis TaxID=2528011 RepID=A0A518BR01_9BACT|nr:FG-GAP repeat protein [Planctomycetes bacterium Pla133]QDV03737.1 FG-GAP repeat protein [Planctomycetes bacterium Pla86]